jgi:hypothetical protein
MNSAKPPSTESGLIGVVQLPVASTTNPETLSMSASAGTGTRARTAMAGCWSAARSTRATARRGIPCWSMN